MFKKLDQKKLIKLLKKAKFTWEKIISKIKFNKFSIYAIDQA